MIPALAIPEMVDVAYDLATANLPPGYEWPLYVEVSRRMPWIADSLHAGIHPVRGSILADGSLLVARRTKLVVRMPRDRVCAASVLEGTELDLEGARLKVGPGTFRKLRSAATLYSPRVAMDEPEEAPFRERVDGALEELGIRRPFICGRRVVVTFDDRPHPAFGVAVHGLDEEQSLLLQGAGLGLGRAVGCGLFVPHKVIA